MMNKEQAVSYLRFSGFSDEQIKAIEGAFTCDKCVYSTNEGCQYDDITETIPPFDDCISRQAVIDEISKARDINLGILPTGHRSYEDILRCVAMAYDMGKDHALNVLRSMPPVNPQKPKARWIPVCERLPEDGQYVMVTFGDKIAVCLAQDNNGTLQEVTSLISKNATEIWLYPEPKWGDGYAAWMPLPEPYKAEGSGE
jgi:hypothetical protein